MSEAVCPNCEVPGSDHSVRQSLGCRADLFGVDALGEDGQAVYAGMAEAADDVVVASLPGGGYVMGRRDMVEAFRAL